MQYGIEYDISFDHLVSCNYYSQGCDGGFGFEIARFAKENGLISVSDWDKINKTTSANERCHAAYLNSKKEGVTIKKYDFILGSYPPTNNKIPNPNNSTQSSYCDLPKNERLIMEEIAKNGPIVVNLFTTSDFYRYKYGVYVPMFGSKLMDVKLR